MKRSVWIAFGVLCLVSGSSWVLPDDGGAGTLGRQALLFGVMGVAALCGSGRRRFSGARWRLAGAGVGLFGVPLLVVEIARGSVGELSRVALFAMTPVVVVMVVAAGENEGGARRRLAPALAGLGGLLLLLPLEYPAAVRGWEMVGLLACAVILAGFSSVWLYRMLRGVSFASALGVVGLANAAFLLGCGALRGELAWSWSGLASPGLLVDAVEVGLILWLLREMPPERFAARYLLIPLVTILESYVVMRPQGTVRMGGGTLLLAAGGVLLAGLREEDQAGDLSLG